MLESTQDAGDLKGDIYAVVEHPYATVRTALSRAANWCDLLILHLNIKSCRAGEAADRAKPARVVVNLGKKYDQPLEQTYEVDFDYRVAAQSADFLQVRLNAENGPLGTKDYRIVLEAVPLEAARSFIHLAYSYGYGFAATERYATQLHELGADEYLTMKRSELKRQAER